MIREWLHDHHFIKGKIMIQYMAIAIILGFVAGVLFAQPILKAEASERLAVQSTWHR